MLLFILLSGIAYHSNAQNNCTVVRDGIFYSYPKNTTEQWKSERAGNIQHEINLANGDTSVWQINWQNDCSYTMKYLSGGKQLKKEDLALLKQHNLAFKIETVTKDYYIFSEYLDKVSKTPFLKDTMWTAEKNIVADNRLFSLTTQQEVRKSHFKDTSQYALLYVYRPSKLVCSLVEYLVNANDVAMCSARSNSAYIFKIWKEGTIRLSAKNNNKGTEEKLDVQLGHKYYLKCDINWNMDRCIPAISIVDEAKGLAGFLEVQ